MADDAHCRSREAENRLLSDTYPDSKMSTTYVATGLRGSVRYFPQGPYAFGEPVWGHKARIRLDEPAEVERIDGRRVLYQRYHLYDADQIPHGDTEGLDTEHVKHYVEELRALLCAYPNQISQLTVLEAAETSTVVHGEVTTEFDGQNEMEVLRLSPLTRWRVKKQLEQTP